MDSTASTSNPHIARSAPSWMRKVVSRLPEPLLAQLEQIRYMGLPEPFRTVRRHSLLTYINLFFLQELGRRLDHLGIEGDFVECGVYRGGSAGVLGYSAQSSPFRRHLWLFDSFEGMPAATEKDDDYSHQIENLFVGSEEQTRSILSRLQIQSDNYTIVRGRFENTYATVKRTPVALLHVDCDFYEPVKLTLEKFYPDVVSGGYVVFNDYGSFAGCRTATDEFMSAWEIAAPLIQIDKDAYFFQKP